MTPPLNGVSDGRGMRHRRTGRAAAQAERRGGCMLAGCTATESTSSQEFPHKNSRILRPCCMLHAVCLMSLMKNDSASSSRANSHPQEIAV
jgi:hypothetical protein